MVMIPITTPITRTGQRRPVVGARPDDAEDVDRTE